MSALRPCTGSVLLTAALTLAGLGLPGCGDDSEGAGGGGGATSATTTSAGATTSTVTGSSHGSTSSTAQSSSGQGGDTSATGTGGAASSGGGGSGGEAGVGGGAAAFADDCEDAEDCPGGDCVDLPGSDFRACKFPVVEATECGDQEVDDCCSSVDCQGDDVCVELPDVPYCGGVPPLEHNVCVPSDDTCNSLDCGKSGDTCIPPGVYGYSRGACAARACTGDDDCGDEAGGRCVPVFNPCCGAVSGFFCAYPSDGCRDQADCDVDRHCEGHPDTGRASCVDGPAECPA